MMCLCKVMFLCIWSSKHSKLIYQDPLNISSASCELQQHLIDLQVCGGWALSFHHSQAFEICPRTSVFGLKGFCPFLTLQLRDHPGCIQGRLQRTPIFLAGNKTNDMLHEGCWDLHNWKSWWFSVSYIWSLNATKWAFLLSTVLTLWQHLTAELETKFMHWLVNMSGHIQFCLDIDFFVRPILNWSNYNGVWIETLLGRQNRKMEWKYIAKQN